ncbi:ribonuclease H [Fusarium coicis]|nr:ribonuclease H [Fusarium coicis]
MIADTTGYCIQHIRYFSGPYRLRKDRFSVIIQIDRACRRNGTQYVRGGWGVFLGPNSQYNNWSLLPPNAPQTSTYAELCALVVALEMVRDELPLENFLNCESSSSEEEEYEDNEEEDY